MTMPTTKELLEIHSKAMAGKSDAQYITERIEAGVSAVRDAVLEAAAQDAKYLYASYQDNYRLQARLPIGRTVSKWLRSLKGGGA